MGDREAQGIRSAGWSLVAAGVMFAVVGGYLYGVLMPLGLTIDMFDATDALLNWASEHTGAYVGLYLLYAMQQVALMAAPLLLWRWLPESCGAPWARALAAVAVTVSLALAVLSTALLIMSTHTAIQYWGIAESASQRFDVLMMFDATADMAKGARLISEPLLGVWLVWVAVVLVHLSNGRRAWAAVGAVGVWTAIVGIWKLLDPLMPFEDWVAFVIAAAQVAAGIGFVRLAATASRELGSPVSQ